MIIQANLEYEGRSWVSLKQLDEAAECAKGNAFKLFKLMQSSYQEGEDFFVLSEDTHGQCLEQWRQAGLLYNSSVRAILLSQAMAQAVLNNLNARI